MSDDFGEAGRAWLEALELAPDERETVEGALRHVDFLDGEVGSIERALAGQALSSAEIRRLMTVPGVSLISAATFVAVVGDVTRRHVQEAGLVCGARPKGAAVGRGARPSWAHPKARARAGPPQAPAGGLGP